MPAGREPGGAGKRLSIWQRLAVAANTLVALAVGAYGAAGSYDSVFHLAVRHHVPLPRLVPAGIDGGLALTVLTDIVLTWIGLPIWWLRASARIFVAGTIAANAAAGWPDPVAVFLHCFPPVIVLIVVEAGRTSLLRKNAAGAGRDPIPLRTWIASPLATPALWRRMAQWGVTSYTRAVEIEIARRQAIMRLREHYGDRDWRKAAPSDLVWLLRTGNRITEACARVEAIAAVGGSGSSPGRGNRGGSGSSHAAGSGNRGRAGSRGRPGTGQGNRGRNQPGSVPGTGSGNRTADRAALLEAARHKAAEHRAANGGREITVAELAIALGRRKKVAGELLRAIKAETGGQVQP